MRVGQVGLDDASDDIDRRALSGHDQMDAGRARLLRQPLDQELDLLTGGHHQVGKLVHDHYDLRQDFIFELLGLVERLARVGVVARLDTATELRALGLRLTHLRVEAWKRPNTEVRHHAIALLHLLDRPLQRADCFARLCNNGGQEVWDVVVHAQFEHLRVDHDQFALVRAVAIQQRQDHAVETHRLARAGGAGDEQVRHWREIGDNRVARYILSQDQRQGHVLILERLTSDQLRQADRLALRIRKLDPYHAATRNGRNASGQCRHVACDIVGQSDHPAGLDAACRFELVHRDHGARPDLDDVAADVEIFEHGLEQARVAFEPGAVDRLL